jgi:quercetin dioxygenase-like cupin family protein
MTCAYYPVKAGAVIHSHAHPNEEVCNVLEGEFELTVDGETRIAGPRWVGVVPADVEHSVRALRDGRVIVVDHPARHVVGGVHTS